MKNSFDCDGCSCAGALFSGASVFGSGLKNCTGGRVGAVNSSVDVVGGLNRPQ